MSEHEHTHEDKKFKDVDRLRRPDRLERLEVERVTGLSLEGLAARQVLDVGTGTGVFAEAFAERGLEVTGVDLNPQMLEAAKTHVPAAKFQEASAEKLPFADKSFDLVFFGVVLHEVDDLALTLSEALRVSRGRVVGLEWAYREEDFGPPLAHRLKPETIYALAEQAGYAGVDTVELSQLVLYRLEVQPKPVK